MGKITKIEQQKNNEDRVNIYIDDTFFIGTFKEVVYKLGLAKGKEINEEALKSVTQEEAFSQAKEKSFRILSRAMQSEGQLRYKLTRAGFEESTIDKVMDKLKYYNMIDDQEMARLIIKDKKNIKRFGKRRIAYDLQKKNIDKKMISHLIEKEVTEEEEYENALYLAEKKVKKIKDSDPRKVQQKLTQHLSYKGFDYDIIRRVVRKVTRFEEY